MNALEFVRAQIAADRTKAAEFEETLASWENGVGSTATFVMHTLIQRAATAEALLAETAVMLEDLDWDVAFSSVDDALEAYIAPVLARHWAEEPGFDPDWKLSSGARREKARAEEPPPARKPDPVESLDLPARAGLTGIEADELRRRGS